LWFVDVGPWLTKKASSDEGMGAMAVMGRSSDSDCLETRAVVVLPRQMRLRISFDDALSFSPE
jgi:hypothetical protein